APAVPRRAALRMAGHSRWANIRRRESALALRRDKRLARAAPQGCETVRYGGYGPGGAAVMVECVTDDRRQVGAKVRRAVVQHGGRLGADGPVSYLYNTVGLKTYAPATDDERPSH